MHIAVSKGNKKQNTTTFCSVGFSPLKVTLMRGAGKKKTQNKKATIIIIIIKKKY